MSADFWQFEAQHGRDCQENKHKSAHASLPGNQGAEQNKTATDHPPNIACSFK